MKAALQNLVLYLLCAASVVLAAPTHSTLLSQPSKTEEPKVFSKPSCVRERSYFTQQKEAKPAMVSVLEGSARFELW
ncbi:MAG: hypothetical protein IBJ16_09840 [Chitinophagaceae bacterium]|nr:hypothetical protein [Chitinophagaceae bacterium]